MLDWHGWLARRSRTHIAVLTTGLVFLIGAVDYLVGTEASFSVVYALPIAIAAWYSGKPLADALAVLGVVVWLAGDFAAGWDYGNWLVPVWNAALRLAIYTIATRMVVYIRSLTSNLESRILARTSELTREIAERERLEREILEVSERERRRLGFDLHDGLCQHLTGTMLAVQVLKEKLARRQIPEAEEANRVVLLIEDGIELSHRLAKGLQPVDMQPGGFMQAIQEFARSTSDLFKVSCIFDCDSPVMISDIAAANQLFRIVQEATSNAVKHGKASVVVISLYVEEERTMLKIRDNGTGFRADAKRGDGLGLKIMAQRANLIGAEFQIAAIAPVGTVISCSLPERIGSGEIVNA